MELRFSNGNIRLQKVLNSLDEFVVDFTSLLAKHGVKYVIVSGYVSILFGRSRSSEDIDIIVEKLPFAKFRDLWKLLCVDFECVNAGDAEDAYENYLNQDTNVRFSRKGSVIPNMELKFSKLELEQWALENRIKVVLNGKEMFVSPLELQISYKLFLGSEKDIEDARYLYKLFIDKLDMRLLGEFNKKLKVADAFNKYCAPNKFSR